MSVINSQPLIGASGQGGGYNLDRSLRFRSSASAYLNRTPASAGNRKTFTWSAWVKRGSLTTTNGGLFGARGASGAFNAFQFTSSDTLQTYSYDGSTFAFNFNTTQVFRDPSAWYHIVFAFDTTQATSTNRVKIYVNGSQITAFSTATYPSQNFDTAVNSTIEHFLSVASTSDANYLDGYMTEVNFIDGQALTPSSFGETSASTGVWIPKKYTGTYGTNGFYLDFKDNSALTTSSNAGLGKDNSGNGNYWTTNNISITSGVTYDSMTDVPTLTSATAANYAVMNPLDKDISRGTVDNGNLRLTYASFNSLNAAAVRSTLGTSTGKWYFECVNQTWNGGGNTGYMTITSNTGSLTGVSAFAGSLTNFIGVDATVFSNAVTFRTNGLSASLADGTTLFASYASGDVINFAFDLDAGKIWIGKNGTWYNSGNPSAGTNHTSTFTAGGVTFFSEFEATTSSNNLNQSSILPNFGQQPFAYTPPSGFVALNTFNLPTPTIGATASSQANKYFDATLYTGNGSSLSVTNSGSMQPDFVWIKERPTSSAHALYDSLRGNSLVLSSNSTAADFSQSPTAGLNSFNSNGFSVTYPNTGDYYINRNGQTYVGWQWRASNATGVTNTAGSITSTVSANTTAGFSIVTYTADGGVDTIGHGLGVAPSMIILKSRNNTSGWTTYHASVGNTGALNLQTTGATSTSSDWWNNTSPTSTVFTIGANTNINTWTWVAYCFAEVAGYSRFGSYTGNGSSDGTFVFTGFRPAFVMVKGYTGTSSDTTRWLMLDKARDEYNATDSWLYANLSNAEATLPYVDFLSNGFKFRDNNLHINQSGISYIYMALAENPFKYANAR